MFRFPNLPTEILWNIAEYVGTVGDLSSLSRSCRALYAALTPRLYRNVKDDPSIMCWACDEGRIDTVQRLLDAGANANTSWVQETPRWWTLMELQGIPLVLDKQPFVRSFYVDASGWLFSRAATEYEMISYFEEGYYHVDDITRYGAAELGLFGESVYFSFSSRPPSDYYGRDPPQSPMSRMPRRQCYWTALHIAAAWGNDGLVTLLLDNSADIDAPSRLFCKCATPPDRLAAPFWTPLHTAICHGHESTTRLLLSRGASINVTAPYWYYGNRHLEKGRPFTALHSACAAGFLEAARLLIDGGYQTDIRVRDHDDLTPFAHAFIRHHWDVIDFLVERGANINARIGPLTALGHACLLGYFSEALRLLDMGATVQPVSRVWGGSPFYFEFSAVAGAPETPSCRAAKQQEHRVELLNRLAQYGVDVNQQGVNVNQYENDGPTPLMEASLHHRVDVVKALLESGANVRYHGLSTINGECPLLQAIDLDARDHVPRMSPKGAMLDTCRVLLEAMSQTPAPLVSENEATGLDDEVNIDDLTIRSAFLRTCASLAKHQDLADVAALFVTYDRATTIAKKEPDVVLKSMEVQNFKITDLLLRNGFDRPDTKEIASLLRKFIEDDAANGLSYLSNRFDNVADQILNSKFLFRMVRLQKHRCAQFLIEEGVPINTLDDNGTSLLFHACSFSNYNTVKLLLECGADPNERNKEGVLVACQAATRDFTDILELLLDFGALIHSSPTGAGSVDKSETVLLDVAISLNLTNAVEEILTHEKYGCPTEEEISRHWQSLINSRHSAQHPMDMASALIHTHSKGFEVDKSFVLTCGASRGVITTPLHLCAMVGKRADRAALIRFLVGYADIHKLLPGKPDHRTCPTPPLESAKTCLVRFEGTTPLEWAIEFSSTWVVRAMLSNELYWQYDETLSEEMDRGQTLNKELMLRYARAACRRQKPEMLSLLFLYGLDPNICDEDGNTMIHLICDYVGGLWPKKDGNPESTMEHIADRAGMCLLLCLKWDVACDRENKQGVSGTDRALQIMQYSGSNEFYLTLAEQWRERVMYLEVEGCTPSLEMKMEPEEYDSEDDEGANLPAVLPPDED
jgi:ankyrin repeat protein